MRKNRLLLLVTGALALATLGMWWTGWYPVVSVNGTLISARAWHRMVEAEKRVVNVHAHASGAALVNFASPQGQRLLGTIRRDMLTLLIDSVLMRTEGARAVPDLEHLSLERVNAEVSSSTLTDVAASQVYGLNLAILKQAVLIPQARQEILSETLAADHRDFATWLREARTRARVRFFFVSFRWDPDEGVK